MLDIELNKLEDSETGGCRAFFLFRNGTGKSFEAFEMSLAVLNTQGVIDVLLTINSAPLPVSRTTLKLFEVPDIACDSISELLLHELAVCKPQNEEPIDCFPMITLASRSTVKLVQ